MKTTALYRELAREAESHCDWQLAAEYLNRAITAYPPGKTGGHVAGSLGAKDVANMERHLKSLRAMQPA